MQETWDEIRARIIARDRACSGRFLGGECSAILDVHHIRPRDEGGTDDPSNLMVLCHVHHPMLEALRKAILKRRVPARRTCPHRHPYPGAREACERRLNAAA
jgi:5-methylcytosine-specific restriction endonuclease McrA